MKDKSTSSQGTPLKRRAFLTHTAALGGVAAISSVAATPAISAVTGACGARSAAQAALEPGNVTVRDFTDLLGQPFRMRDESGNTMTAQLVEANLPATQSALRFRREHFSIVFDVPRDVALTQGQYQVAHPQLGSMDLFMVPVDLPSRHNRLEAIFS